jgi:hypothetical protein
MLPNLDKLNEAELLEFERQLDQLKVYSRFQRIELSERGENPERDADCAAALKRSYDELPGWAKWNDGEVSDELIKRVRMLPATHHPQANSPLISRADVLEILRPGE